MSEKGPEEQHRFVGRLMAAHEALEKSISKTPSGNLHIIDLLVTARDATHKAMMAAWTAAPSFPDETST